MTAWVVTHVFLDACMRPGGDAQNLVETPTAADIVDALTGMGGIQASEAVADTIGGHPAQRIDLTVPEDYAREECDGQMLRLWPGTGGDLSAGQLTYPGQRMSIYVLDLNGDPVVLLGARMADAPLADVAELDAILSSIRFDGAGP